MNGICFMIDTGELADMVWEFRICLEEARTSMEEIQEEFCRLEGAWSGKAREAFRARTERDMAFLNEYLREMSRFAACLEFAKEEYDRTEQEMEVYVGRL